MAIIVNDEGMARNVMSEFENKKIVKWIEKAKEDKKKRTFAKREWEHDEH